MAVVISTGAAQADFVSVTAGADGPTVSGELLSFDGRYMRVDSAYGIVTLDAQAVECTGAACPVPGAYVPDLMISGAAESVDRLLTPMLEAFAAEKGYGYVRQDEDATHILYVLLVPEENNRRVARIRFRLTSSREGFADLLADQADMTLAAREPTEQEQALASDAGAADFTNPRYRRLIARDAVVAVVSPGNPLQSIKADDLRRIYAGEVTNWAQVGGPDQPISLHLSSQSLGDAARGILDGPGDAGASYHADLGALADAVHDDPFALGVSMRSSMGPTRPLSITGPCGISMAPTARALKSGDYPWILSYELYLPARRLPPVARELVAFLTSREAGRVIEREWFAGQQITGLGLAQQGDRLIDAIRATGSDVGARSLRQILEVLDGAERLTPTFRFADDALDFTSEGNLDGLVAAIESGAFDGKRLILAGFSDAVGGAAANRDVSRRRAGAVRDLVIERLGPDDAERVPIEIHGFGEAMPVACDDGGGWGTVANRRVETWLQK